MSLRASDRFALAMECAVILFLCAAIPGAFWVWRHGGQGMLAYSPAVGLPGGAALIFIAVGVTVSGLFAVDRIAFPLNVTLPIVFTTLLLATHAIWTQITTRGSSIAALPEGLREADVWAHPGLLGLTVFLQFAALSGVAVLKRR
jgi:hypothetical protein